MVKIRIIAEEVSNKYGASYEEMRTHGYRGGIAFKGVMEDGDKKMYFVLAQGEFLNSFPLGMNLKSIGGTYYVNFYENGGYESSCGWRTWNNPYVFPEETEEAEETGEVVHDVLFWKLFNEYKFALYCEFIKRFDLRYNIAEVIPEQDRYLLPLLYTFARTKNIEINKDVFLIEKEYSFKTEIMVQWKEKKLMLPFYLTKQKYYTVYNTINTITVIQKNKLDIINQDQRLVVYLSRYDRSGDLVEILGWEVDGEVQQPTCRILPVDMNDLLERRLGDILFIEEERAKEVSYRIITSLGRVEILKGKTEEANTEPNGILIESESEDEKVVVYHPEHGTLTLKPGKYVLFSVPYIGRRRNDD